MPAGALPILTNGKHHTMKKTTILLAVTSAVMIGGSMAVPGDLAEVEPAEARNLKDRGKGRVAVPGVDYDPADYPHVANNDAFEGADDGDHDDDEAATGDDGDDGAADDETA